jgi:prepilin-type N-terminal cleavage/methylation domain-containing protein
VLKRDDQRGFTLIELSVAMTLMLLVTGALLVALESGTRAERHASSRIDSEQSVRLVLAQLTRDVGDANALLPAINPNQIDLGFAGGGEVRWWYDGTGHILRRMVPDPHIPGAWDYGVSITGLTNASGTAIHFLASDGTDMFAAADATPADQMTCTATIAVTVTSKAQPPSLPFTEAASAPLNAVADRRGCP